MRSVEIHLLNTGFIPGERIEGSVLVNCEESFDYNRLVIMTLDIPWRCDSVLKIPLKVWSRKQ